MKTLTSISVSFLEESYTLKKGPVGKNPILPNEV